MLIIAILVALVALLTILAVVPQWTRRRRIGTDYDQNFDTPRGDRIQAAAEQNRLDDGEPAIRTPGDFLRP